MNLLGICLAVAACVAYAGMIVLALCKSAAKGDEMIERKGTEP